MDDQRGRWLAVGEAITARMARMPISQAELSRASGVSDATVRALMRGVPRGTPRPPIPARICKALGWTPDSIDRLLAGDEPELLGPAPANNHVTRDEFTQLRDAVESLRRQIEDLAAVGEHFAREAEARRQRRKRAGPPPS